MLDWRYPDKRHSQTLGQNQIKRGSNQLILLPYAPSHGRAYSRMDFQPREGSEEKKWEGGEKKLWKNLFDKLFDVAIVEWRVVEALQPLTSAILHYHVSGFWHWPLNAPLNIPQDINGLSRLSHKYLFNINEPKPPPRMHRHHCVVILKTPPLLSLIHI